MRATQSVLLIGHGSAHDPGSGAPVRAVAARLGRAEHFREVSAAFLKEGPAPRAVLDSLTSPHVFVIPMFLADGHYARDVVPRALGLERPTTRRGSQWIHYSRPLGTHAGMTRIAADRALAALAGRGVDPAAADLVLAGHGTERSATSAGTVRAAARALQRENLFHAVGFGLLDEAPLIEDAVSASVARCVVVVPYFLAVGWHVRQTLPERLIAVAARASKAGRTALYTQPVGTSNRLDIIVLDLVDAAAMRWQQEANRPLTRDAHARFCCCCGCTESMAGMAVAAEGVCASV